MDLSIKSEENLAFMVEGIKEKMQVINAGMIQPESFDLSSYEDIHEIYVMVNKKSSLSVAEMQALLAELGKMRVS
ncbi:DUF1128 domain-containing protein [Guptibacillus hwajinpoensis]|uniref:Uncharacterized protein n=1 Tax=Guptibacillus hwajinpoensis TaxID=208199 RepID=A0A0J6FWG1_9BACL|nr:DUF1128 domain-containing protein [Alkalihalobacillus macyae]KMM38707.1 hypothetical protein AB986_05385 [Alkalihalobacillus macyae]MDP4551201.1 DUF1128 domain-containing protein [Alkalihalobacillus macyae]